MGGVDWSGSIVVVARVGEGVAPVVDSRGGGRRKRLDGVGVRDTVCTESRELQGGNFLGNVGPVVVRCALPQELDY